MDSFRLFLREGVRDYRPDIFNYLEKQPDDVLIHFSNHFRVGFHTKPGHFDPVGIYTFPKKYVMSQAFNRNHHFFGMKNVFILRLKPGVKTLNLSTLTDSEADDLIARMGISRFKDETSREHKAGHIFWNTIQNYLNQKHTRPGNMEWNRLLKKAGSFDVLIDDGDGIIHYREPSQVVILTPGVFVEVSKFSTTVQRIYKDLSLRVMNTLSQMLFDNFQIHTKREGYGGDKVKLTSHGTKGERPFSISLTYENHSQDQGDTLKYSLSGQLFLSSPVGKNYTTDSIDIPTDSSEYDINLELRKVAEKMKAFMGQEDNYRQSMQPVVAELIKQVCARLGLGRGPRVEGEYATYQKVYPQFGKFAINCYYSGYGNTFHVSMSLQKTDRGRLEGGRKYSRDVYTLYGNQNAELPAAEVIADVPKAARWFVRENLHYWDEVIAKHYNPDYDKHSKYDRDSGRAYGLMRTGAEMQRFVDLMRYNRNRVMSHG